MDAGFTKSTKAHYTDTWKNMYFWPLGNVDIIKMPQVVPQTFAECKLRARHNAAEEVDKTVSSTKEPKSSTANVLCDPEWAPQPLKTLLLTICNRKWQEHLISELLCNSVFNSFRDFLPENCCDYFFLEATNQTNLILLAWLVAHHRGTNGKGMK